MNIIGMIPVLASALQEEHQQRIKTEGQMNDLKNDNIALKKRLDMVEAIIAKLSAYQQPGK